MPKASAKEVIAGSSLVSRGKLDCEIDCEANAAAPATANGDTCDTCARTCEALGKLRATTDLEAKLIRTMVRDTSERWHRAFQNLAHFQKLKETIPPRVHPRIDDNFIGNHAGKAIFIGKESLIPMSRAPKPVNVKNVYAKESNIANGGQGLFLRHPLRRGEIICSYAGRLFDASEAKFRDPTYMVNFELGRGFKLDGDDVDGDLGHYANATRRNEAGVFTPPVNAAISLRGKAQWSSIDAKTGEVVCRGRFDLVARSDLQVLYILYCWQFLI